MDGQIRLKDGKAWRCKFGHLLGVKIYEWIGNHRGWRLYILPKALETDPESDQPLEWKSRTEFTNYDIRCEVCGGRKTWWAGKAAMDKILLNADGRKPDI